MSAEGGLIYRASASVGLYISYNEDEGITFGPGISAEQGGGLFLGGGLSFEFTASRAPNVAQMSGEYEKLGAAIAYGPGFSGSASRPVNSGYGTVSAGVGWKGFTVGPYYARGESKVWEWFRSAPPNR